MSVWKQLSFFTGSRAPAQRRYATAQPGVCSTCGRFSLRTRATKFSGRRVPGITKPKVAPARCCEGCRPRHDLFLVQHPKRMVSPTAAVQLLYGCPRAHQLQMEHPRQPISVEHATGTIVHKGLEKFWGTTFSSRGAFRHATYSSLDWLLGQLEGARLFKNGIAFRGAWEKETVCYLVEQLFLFLHSRGHLLSGKQKAAAAKALGTEMVWEDTELRWPPMVTLDWLAGGSGITFLTDHRWRFTGVIDLIVLTRQRGRCQLHITDYKIPGVDCHPQLGGEDYSLQLRLYAAWATEAFATLGLTPEDIVLRAMVVTLNPMGIKNVPVCFDSSTHLRTLLELEKALAALEGYRHLPFPAKPRPWLCQGCDFGFARHLCPESLADASTWGLGVPYLHLGPSSPTRKRDMAHGEEEGKCPFCGAPLKRGRFGRPVCSQPLYNDCPRDDC